MLNPDGQAWSVWRREDGQAELFVMSDAGHLVLNAAQAAELAEALTIAASEDRT